MFNMLNSSYFYALRVDACLAGICGAELIRPRRTTFFPLTWSRSLPWHLHRSEAMGRIRSIRSDGP